jgi:polyhydroxyalkanoate synthesis regulator phasin
VSPAEYDSEPGDATEALKSADDINSLLRSLARKQRVSDGASDLNALREQVLSLTPEQLAQWERGYREHVDVPSTGPLSEDEQALVRQYDGYEEAAEIIRIVRGAQPPRAAAAISALPRRMDSDDGVTFRGVVVHRNADGTFKISDAASGNVIETAASEGYERDLAGRRGPERMRLVMRRGSPYWETVRGAPPVPPTIPTDDAAHRRIAELERQLREAATREADRDQMINRLNRQVRDLTERPTARTAPAEVIATAPVVDTAEAQLRDMFGENAEQIRMSLNEAYGGYDPDVVNELLRVELAAVGIVDSHDVLTAVGGLRDITGRTADRWPDARERAYLKELMQNKRGLTRVLRELSRKLDGWKKFEDDGFVEEYVPLVMEQAKRGTVARWIKGTHSISQSALANGVGAALSAAPDRAGVARLLRLALRSAPESLRTKVVDEVHLYLTGDDTVVGTRAYRLRQNVELYGQVRASRIRR